MITYIMIIMIIFLEYIMITSHKGLDFKKARLLQLTLAGTTRFSRHCFGFQSRRFSLLVGYNI